MSWLKDIHGNFVSVSAVATGTPTVTRAGERRVELKDAHGRVLAITTPDALDPPETVIAGPLAAAFISPTGEVQWRAVAAWSVNRTTGKAEAIIAGDPAVGTMFVEFADRSMLGMGQRFADLKAATKAVREAAEQKGIVLQ